MKERCKDEDKWGNLTLRGSSGEKRKCACVTVLIRQPWAVVMKDKASIRAELAPAGSQRGESAHTTDKNTRLSSLARPRALCFN